MPLQQVHLRVNDAATGKPTPVRLRITDADGNYYAPHGRLTEFATGPNQDVGGNVLIGVKKWAYIDGTCEILLPPGQLHIEITKGFEYTPIDDTITLLAGKLSLRFEIPRWCDLRKDGWYSGDTRAHFLSPDAALLEGQAEDVAVVNLLAEEADFPDAKGNWFEAIPNLLSFSGQQFARQTDDCGVAVNTLNSHLWHGDLALLNCHRVVYPLRLGGERHKDNQALADWCDQCHRKKGLVVWAESLRSVPHLFPYGEPLADLILGKIDAIEMTGFHNSEEDALADYYRFLDAGLLVPLAGASGKRSNTCMLGGMRTYAHLPPGTDPTYGAWIESVRAGRTYVTNGPLVDFSINGVVPASAAPIRAGNAPLRVQAQARSRVRFDWLKLLWNGRVIEEARAADGPPWQASLAHEWAVSESGWLAVVCSGEAEVAGRGKSQKVFAHSSAIPVHDESGRDWASRFTVEQLIAALDKLAYWGDKRAYCDTPQQRARLCRVFEEARTLLAKKLSPI